MNEDRPDVPPAPAGLSEPRTISRARWWIHLLLISFYLLLVAVVGLGHNRSYQPALSHTAGGLLLVCAIELFLFAIIFSLAWVASRASVDDLLLRWRGKGMPLLLGAAYSIGLRVGIGVVAAAIAAVLLLTGAMKLKSMEQLAERNRPGVENVVDVAALRNNPAYFWLTLTVVSFVVAGLREELWRSSFLAGLRALWPRQFASAFGQVWAVVVAAIFFGMGHLSMGVLAALLAGLLGLGLGLIMVFHRSIWPAVLAHGFFDATSMALIPWALEMMKQLPKH